MATDRPPSWRSPDYVAAVVGVVATGALCFYGALTDSAPPPETVGFVLAWVLVPTTIAREVTRRWL